MVSWRLTGADHGDRARLEEPLDAGGLGAVLAAAHDADRGVGGVDRELEGEHALLVAAHDLVPGRAEGLDHPVVVGQHLGGEALEPPLAARLGQVLQEQLGDAPAVVLVLDEERHLRRPRPLVGVVLVGDGVVAADRDHPAPQQHHQRHPAVVVDLGEPPHVAVGEVRHRAEEPVVLRPVAHPGVELDQQLGVLGPDRPDVRRPPVTQQDVGLPVPGRCGRLGVGLGVRGHPLDPRGRCDARITG